MLPIPSRGRHFQKNNLCHGSGIAASHENTSPGTKHPPQTARVPTGVEPCYIKPRTLSTTRVASTDMVTEFQRVFARLNISSHA